MTEAPSPAGSDAASGASGSNAVPREAGKLVLRTPGFGLGLMLISALGTLVGGTVMVTVDWRAGLAVYALMIATLLVFLCWEMQRHRATDASAGAPLPQLTPTQLAASPLAGADLAGPELATTKTNSL